VGAVAPDLALSQHQKAEALSAQRACCLIEHRRVSIHLTKRLHFDEASGAIGVAN